MLGLVESLSRKIADIERRSAIEAIRFLNQPMMAIQVRDLRQFYKEFQRKGDIKELLGSIEEIRGRFGEDHKENDSSRSRSFPNLTREDLRLICFDLVSGG